VADLHECGADRMAPPQGVSQMPEWLSVRNWFAIIIGSALAAIFSPSIDGLVSLDHFVVASLSTASIRCLCAPPDSTDEHTDQFVS
jgi:hypothetical protein